MRHVDPCRGTSFRRRLRHLGGTGVCARGCRLDERGLLDAEPAIKAAIANRVDLLVINRFSRAGSLGRGLLSCFVAALEAGVPVLTAVRAPYEEAWRGFHGGLAHDLPTEGPRVIGWALRTIPMRDAAEPTMTASA